VKFLFTRSLIVLGFLSLIPSLVFAIDHNNVDAGRPLNFDDAEAIAYRERAVEAGVSGAFPNDGPSGLGLGLEFLYGFALNTHLSLDLDPSVGGRAGSDETRFDAGDLSIGLLHNFNREFGSVPAFSLRSDVAFPTGRDSDGVNVRLRGIMSKVLHQYERIHVNLDGTYRSEPEPNERKFQPAALVGISKPLGYPRNFNRTGLAEVRVRQSETFGTGPIASAGVGLRQQVTVRSVVDIGIQSDIIASRNAPHDDFRITAGYSVSY